jgi:hypothetical protein
MSSLTLTELVIPDTYGAEFTANFSFNPVNKTQMSVSFTAGNSQTNDLITVQLTSGGDTSSNGSCSYYSSPDVPGLTIQLYENGALTDTCSIQYLYQVYISELTGPPVQGQQHTLGAHFICLGTDEYYNTTYNYTDGNVDNVAINLGSGSNGNSVQIGHIYPYYQYTGQGTEIALCVSEGGNTQQQVIKSYPNS